MKIYFASSIRAGRDDVDIYLQIIKELQKYGEASLGVGYEIGRGL